MICPKEEFITRFRIFTAILVAVVVGICAVSFIGCGSGCLVTYAEPKDRDRVIEALKSAGSQILPFKISKEGVRKIL